MNLLQLFLNLAPDDTFCIAFECILSTGAVLFSKAWLWVGIRCKNRGSSRMGKGKCGSEKMYLNEELRVEYYAAETMELRARENVIHVLETGQCS